MNEQMLAIYGGDEKEIENQRSQEMSVLLKTAESLNSDQMKEKFRVLKDITQIETFKNQYYFKSDEYKNADKDLVKAIEDFGQDLEHIGNLYMDLTKANKSFISKSDNCQEYLQVWLRDILNSIKMQMANIKILTAPAELDSHVKNLKEIHQKIDEISEDLRKLRTKPYHAKLAPLFEAKVDQVHQLIDFQEDPTYQKLSEHCQKLSNAVFAQYEEEIKQEVVKKENEKQIQTIEEIDILTIDSVIEDLEAQLGRLNEIVNENIEEFLNDDQSRSQKLATRQKEIELKRSKMAEASLQDMEKINQDLLKFSKEISDSARAPRIYHLIYMFDESGSMTSSFGAKSRFQTIQDSYDLQIKNRADSLSEDLVSVIMFDHKARKVHSKEAVLKRPKLPNTKNGGTNYDAAFEELKSLLEVSSTKYTPMVFFLTDGEGDCKKSEAILKEIYQKYSETGLCMFFGVSKDGNFDTLKKLALVGNGSKKCIKIGDEFIDLFYHLLNEEDVEKAFRNFENALENRNSIIKVKLGLTKQLQGEIRQSDVKTNELLLQMLEHDKKLDESMSKLRNAKLDEKKAFIEKEKAFLVVELKKEKALLQTKNGEVIRLKEENEKLEKILIETKKKTGMIKSQLDDNAKELQNQEKNLKTLKEEEIKNLANFNAAHIKKVNEDFKLTIKDFRLRDIFAHYLKYKSFLKNYEEATQSIELFIEKNADALSFAIRNIQKKIEYDNIIDDSLCLDFLFKRFLKIGLPLKDGEIEKNFKLIVNHIIDEKVKEQMAADLEELLKKAPKEIISISRDKEKRKEYMKSLKIEGKVEVLEKEIRELNKTIDTLREKKFENSNLKATLSRIKTKLQEIEDGTYMTNEEEENKKEIEDLTKDIKKLKEAKFPSRQEGDDFEEAIETIKKEITEVEGNKDLDRKEKKSEIRAIEDKIEKMKQKFNDDNDKKEAANTKKIDEMLLKIKNLKIAKSLSIKEIKANLEKEYELKIQEEAAFIFSEKKANNEKVANLERDIDVKREKIKNLNKTPDNLNNLLDRIETVVESIIKNGNLLYLKVMTSSTVGILKNSILPEVQRYCTNFAQIQTEKP